MMFLGRLYRALCWLILRKRPAVLVFAENKEETKLLLEGFATYINENPRYEKGKVEAVSYTK